MEKKNEYDVGELIFGVRNLYLQHRKELKLLEHFCTTTNMRVKDFYFYVDQDGKDAPKLCCGYTKNYNALQKGILKVKNLVVGDYFSQLDSQFDGLCIKDSDGKYYIHGDRGEFPVQINSPITFGNMASEILDSEFVQKIKLTKSDDSGSIKSSDGKIVFHSFHIIFGYEGLDHFVLYYPFVDTILFMSFNEKLSAEKIDRALKVKFPSNQLDPYHINAIDTSGILQKSIVFDEVPSSCSVVEYKIDEEENQMILSKVNSFKFQK